MFHVKQADRLDVPLDAEGFRRAAGVSRETLARLEAYAGLLGKWSRAVNLIGRDSLADLWRRHMLDSAQLLDLLPAAPAGRARVVADLGSGAGFPGLVLAVMGAGDVHLVESDARKCAFLREAARVTETDVAIHHGRIEALAPVPADAVTARALKPLTVLVGLARPWLAPGGICLFPKGARAERELTAAGKAWKMRAERIPSRTDPAGVILRLEVLGRDDATS